MSLLTFLLLLLVVYALQRLSKWIHRQPALPFHTSSFSTTFTVHPRNVHVRLQTSFLNRFHDYIATILSKRQHAANIVSSFYTLGVVLGILGMITSLALLVWNVVFLASATYGHFQHEHNHKVQPMNLGRRDVGSEDIKDSPYESAFALRPIIPGLTVPISDLPCIFLSLLIGQFVHEAGHFVSSALHSVPLISSGFSITYFLPSAYLSLASTPLASLRSKHRLQIIAAGCFHNLLAYILLISLSRLGATSLWHHLGYRDVSYLGKAVVSVNEDSPLHAHIPVGSIITYLDDIPLRTTQGSTSSDAWETYLLGTPSSIHLGWCADIEWYQAQPVDCCHPTSLAQANASTACFISFDDPIIMNGHCIDPIPLLTDIYAQTPSRVAPPRGRCSSGSPCEDTQTCIEPHAKSYLLRIKVQHPSSSNENVILWSGPRDEVYDEVQVSHLSPSFPFLPSSFPSIVATFFSYLQLTMLSLYFVNLLPLPFLDGSQLLSVLLAISLRPPRVNEEVDLEALGVASEGHDRRRDTRLDYGRWNAVRGVKMAGATTMVLIGVCVMLGLFNWIIAR